jgi:2-keto-4-pentenoate hydratase
MKYPMADLRRLAAWLCDELVRRGQRPRAGHFITTGAIVGPVRAERRVSADWGPHGALAISFG